MVDAFSITVVAFIMAPQPVSIPISRTSEYVVLRD